VLSKYRGRMLTCHWLPLGLPQFLHLYRGSCSLPQPAPYVNTGKRESGKALRVPFLLRPCCLLAAQEAICLGAEL
jgi:hypothetical protein